MNKNKFKLRFKISIGLLAAIFLIAGCQKSVSEKQAASPASLHDIPALKLNFRFEPDVPAPSAENKPAQAEERNAAVQNDFDTNRKQEALDKSIFSPDKQRILAVYHRVEDVQAEYRLDVYSADGKLISKITPDAMAVHFPDTIVWSPDSQTLAFVAMTRAGGGISTAQSAPTPPEVTDANANTNAEANTNSNVNSNVDTNANVAAPPATPAPAKPVLTFRTEQIYSANREGADLKPLTQNEGLIYFYFVWSPDSSALAALAATWREWQVGQAQTAQRGENFIPAGRPRLVEKNGRIRILDDNVTAVQPVWSPDSAKVALAFDKEVRIYDAIGDAPTQAAIPLRNPLLLSSKPFDDNLRRNEQNGNSNGGANANTGANSNTNVNAVENSNVPVNALVGSLPDENTLVSFNPIIKLEWTEDQMLYLQTGYVKEMKNSADSAHSYLRWHRLIFSPQAVTVN